MRIQYTLGTACGLALACFADAQPVPTTSPPNTQVSPGQPKPAQKAIPATSFAYPPPLYRLGDVDRTARLADSRRPSFSRTTLLGHDKHHQDPDLQRD